MKAREAVAVTGMGCICGSGETLPGAMEALFRGERAPGAPLGFSTDHPEPYPVFEVPSELPGKPGEPELLRTSRLALRATEEALADAGLDAEGLSAMRVGVCLGTTVGSAMNNEPFYRSFREGGHPDMAPIGTFLRSNPAESVARRYGFTGPCQTVVNACASGSDAVGIGADWIREGLCDLVITGGADELCRVTYNGFASLMITDTGPCRPFDVRRRGLNLGEGAAVLLLESPSSIRKRGGRPRGQLHGYGTACDAFHLTKPSPGGEGLSRAVRQALDEGGIRADDVAFVNAHGTGTPDNDRVEAKVMSELLPGVPYLSTKGYTGHTLGAAGAIEAAFTLACLELGRIPGSVGFGEADSALGSTPVTEPTPFSGRHALSQSLAFGGNNAVLLLGSPGGPMETRRA